MKPVEVVASEENNLISREESGSRTKRQRGTGDHDPEKPTFYVSATSPEKFHASIFEQMCLVKKGSVVSEIHFKTNVDGISLKPDEEASSEDYGYVSLTSFHSWTGEVAQAVGSSASFFVGLYSHLTFCSVTFAIFSKEDLEDQSIISWLSVAMIVVLFFQYSIKLMFSWRAASFEFQTRKDQGEIIQSCDVTGEEASRWESWLPFIQMVIMNFAGMSMKIRNAPVLHHNRKVGGDRIFFARLGGARIIGATWGNKYMCQEYDDPMSIHQQCFDFVFNIAMNILKGLVVQHSNAGFGVFTLVNVAIPFAFDFVTLYNISRRYFRRQGLWRHLQKSLATSDAQFRSIARHMIKQYFGMDVAAEPWEKSPLKGGDEYKNPETVARRLEASLEDVQHEMTLLEDSQKLRRAEAQQLLMPSRHRLREASFPCFFEIATPSQVSALGMFPRSFGPFVTEEVTFAPVAKDVAFAPQLVFSGDKPVAWRKDIALGYEGPQVAALGEQSGSHFHLSTLSPVTLGQSEKEAAGIPQEATWFAWSYGNATQEEGTQLLSQFCRAGGYMYFDKDPHEGYKLTHILAVTLQKPEAGSGRGTLGFRKPIGVDSKSPVAQHLENAKKLGFGRPVLGSGVMNGDFPGLRMVWAPSSDFDRATPCHGGFLFYYPDAESPVMSSQSQQIAANRSR